MNNIITIDGPSGVGKGTLAISLAQKLQWNYLNSGSIYRILAYLSENQGINYSNTEALVNLTKDINVEFKIHKGGSFIIYKEKDISDLIQSEYCAEIASKIAANKAVRKSLVETQRAFYRNPGLVAEGRDMGSVIFKDAKFKIFLKATTKIRAKRRYNQLKQKGINVSLSRLMDELKHRDERDLFRKISPLIVPVGALIIDTDNLTILDVVNKAINYIEKSLT